MQPILVRPVDGGQYEIIAGERRYRAAQMAGLDEVPVLVKPVPDTAALAMALIENIQREDLNPLEEAQGVQRLIREFDFTHEQAAQAIGRSRSATSNLLRLLNLATPVQEHADGRPARHGARARAAGVDSARTDPARASHRGARACRCAKPRRWSRSTASRRRRRDRVSARARSRDIVRLEEELADALGASVHLDANAKGRGKLVIEFSSLDQLDGIVARLRRRLEARRRWRGAAQI